MGVLTFTIKVRLLLESKDKVLLLKQRNKTGGKFTLIGGWVEEGESPLEALCREIKEEAGIRVSPKNLYLVHTLHKTKRDEVRIILYYKARNWKGKPEIREPEKFTKVEWHSWRNLPDNLSPTVQHVFEQYRSGKMYSEL